MNAPETASELEVLGLGCRVQGSGLVCFGLEVWFGVVLPFGFSPRVQGSGCRLTFRAQVDFDPARPGNSLRVRGDA